MAWLDVLNIGGLWNGGTPVPVDSDNPLPTSDSSDREYTHVVATVTASGDTTIYTPAAGMKVRLRWIYAMNDPTSATAVLIKVFLDTEEKYRAWALSKGQQVTGPTDGALVINLSGAANVAVTALLEEVA